MFQNHQHQKFHILCANLNISILLGQDCAPDVEEPGDIVLNAENEYIDVEEPVVESLEEKPKELAKEDEDKKRPDILNVEADAGQHDDG